jgi:outer membrane protein assembly factor BamB
MLAGDSTGKVYGVDVKTGKKIWEIQLDGRISSTPVVSAEMLFVATQNGSLYAIK